MTEQKPDETPSLTLKQRKWLDLYIKLGNATEAAWRVYDCKDRHSAESIGTENLHKLVPNIATLMDEMGLTDHALIQKVQEGLGAKVTEFAKHEGKISDERDCVDFPTRHRYLDTAFKLRGTYAPTKQQLEHGGEPMVLQVIFENDENGDSDNPEDSEDAEDQAGEGEAAA